MSHALACDAIKDDPNTLLFEAKMHIHFRGVGGSV
jgi:hypothetical protein